MDFRFYLTYNGVRSEVYEPVGWDTVETSFKREKTHGIVFEVTTNSLGFYGIGKQIILDAIAKEGFNASILFDVTWRCVDPNFAPFYSGRLSLSNNFDVSDDTVNCIIEQQDAVVLFNNRIDQKVDVLSNKTVGGVTIEEATPANIKINGQQLKAVTSGKVDIGGWTYKNLLDAAADSEVVYGDGGRSRHGAIFPLFTATSSDLGAISSNAGYDNSDAITFKLMYDNMFNNNNVRILNNQVKVSARLKGVIKGNYVSSSSGNQYSRFSVSIGFNLGNFIPITPMPQGWEIICRDVVDFTDGVNFDKEFSFLVTLDKNVDRQIRVCIDYWLLNGFTGKELDITFDEESYVRCECLTDLVRVVDDNSEKFSICTAMPAIEALRRTLLLITDNKLNLTSSLYKDLYLTTGKYIRNGSNPDRSTPAIQATFKDLYNSLDSLMCLGIGMYNGAIRVEKWAYFYQKAASPVQLGDIAEIKRTVDNERLISAVKVGYAKYSSEGQNGAEDCFADRDYSTFLETTKSPKEVISKVIGSGYLIEDCRRIAATSDNNGGKYDEDLFFLVSSNGETNPANSYSGASGTSLINSTITPQSNLRQWANYIALSKLGITTYTRVATFTGGTANYMAVVNGVAENSNINLDDYDNLDLASSPSPYIDTFDTPLSKDQFEIIKANPYASIKYGDMEGWVKECRYKMASGEATLSVYPSLATFNKLYQESCQKIEVIKPEEKPQTDIVFIDRFDSWQNGMPYGWIKMNDNGSTMSQIGSAGLLLSGRTTNYDVYKRIIAIPEGSYQITIELLFPLVSDPFDGLSLIVGTQLTDQTKIHRIPAEITLSQFNYTGDINHIKLSFMAGRNKNYTAKVKSITIKKV